MMLRWRLEEVPYRTIVLGSHLPVLRLQRIQPDQSAHREVWTQPQPFFVVRAELCLAVVDK